MANPENAGAETVVLALPSKGSLEEGTLSFLAACGLRVSKINPRQYEARMPAIPQLRVLFQRAEDIVIQVAQGTVDLGITGLDLVAEGAHRGDQTLVIHDALGYGGCDLVLAVPEGWLDVESVADLSDMALDFRQTHGRDLLVATKFAHLTRAFLYENEISHFSIVAAHGAIEAAPALGYADLVIDLTATRTTLRENRLKEINGGTVLHSEACLIGNERALLSRPAVQEVARRMVEKMEATLTGRRFFTLISDLPGLSAEAVVKRLRLPADSEGPVVQGVAELPTLATGEPRWSVTLLCPEAHLTQAVDLLRSAGSGRVVATPVQYFFAPEPRACASLLARLRRARQGRALAP
ncbi:MAG: ATP phosphoribosyltransferase [Chloroflexi bacterium]|nr:ATP phosphoribosyltransferase [Chloroflexota bacterium]